MATLASSAALAQPASDQGGQPTLRGIPRAWATAWRSTRFRWLTLFSAIALPGSLMLLAHFLEWVELRPGVVLPDPILDVLAPHDLTWITFFLIYTAIFATVLRLARNPPDLLFGMQAYALMALLRLCAMYLVPLEAPPGMIALIDPMVQTLGTEGKALTKDLFFSGHTGTLFLLFLLEKQLRARLVFFAATLAIASCVLIQHVHYSVDVLAAPFFADAAYRLARKAHLY